MEDYPEICGNCKYWHGCGGLTSEIGLCRRYPPTKIPDFCATFPVTDLTNWCGEYKEKSP